jgi:hypothetical protein
MLFTGATALVAAVVARKLWRSRQLDLTWLVMVIAMFSVLLVSGTLTRDQLGADKLAPDKRQIQQQAESGNAKKPLKKVRAAQRAVRHRAREMKTQPTPPPNRLNWTLFAQVVMLLYVGGALKFCAAFVPSKSASDREAARSAEAEAVQPLKLLTIAAELGLLILVMRLYNVEGTVLSNKVLPIAFFGFLLHDLMPLRWRPSFFVLLSFTAAYLVFGLASTILLVSIGSLLLSALYLPFSFSVRLTLLLLLGVALAGARFYWANADIVGVMWPILGSMFMFRLISYAHYVRHHKPEPNIPFAVAYFFLLPNVAFPLFPVVDYAIFRRTYYNIDKYATYQTGIRWMARGVTHLLLYRLVYHYLLIGAGEVATFWSLLRYIMANFLLMLRITGQLHLVIGILHLFGFNLPEAVHRLFLASSFSDLWKRANIYWRDFMQKIVFFPTYVRLRNYNPTTRVVMATLAVFLISALLHSYQWFWLRGTFSTSWPEVLFWLAFAIAVTINVVREEKEAAGQASRPTSFAWKPAVAIGLSSTGTFLGVAILWSLWSSDSLSEWLHLWTVAGTGLAKIDIPALVCGTILLTIAVSSVVEHYSEKRVKPQVRRQSFALSTAVTGLLLLALYAVGLPSTYIRFNPKVATAFHHLRADELNQEDAGLLQRAYYENLTRINRFNPRLWGVYMQRRENAPNLQEAGILRKRTGSFLGTELSPGSAAFFKGAPFHVNRWGMRDKDYDETKPANSTRIALLGASPVMGSGVGDDQTFEWLLEDRLNREALGANRYEILNFAVGGYSPLQRLSLMEVKALRFDPDIVFYVAHPGDENLSLETLKMHWRDHVEVPYPEIREIETRAGLVGFDDPDPRQALSPFAEDIMAWTYRRLVDDCRRRNILPVYIFLPLPNLSARMPDRSLNPEWFDRLDDLMITRAARLGQRAENDVQMAREAGFEIIDLSNVYTGEDEANLRVGEFDFHPNAYAHRLIAIRLYHELHADPKIRARLGW